MSPDLRWGHSSKPRVYALREVCPLTLFKLNSINDKKLDNNNVKVYILDNSIIVIITNLMDIPLQEARGKRQEARGKRQEARGKRQEEGLFSLLVCLPASNQIRGDACE
ncbi:MAG: hypothetical protein AB1420_02965 [Bacillota bacterium]